MSFATIQESALVCKLREWLEWHQHTDYSDHRKSIEHINSLLYTRFSLGICQFDDLLLLQLFVHIYECKYINVGKRYLIEIGDMRERQRDSDRLRSVNSATIYDNLYSLDNWTIIIVLIWERERERQWLNKSSSVDNVKNEGNHGDTQLIQLIQQPQHTTTSTCINCIIVIYPSRSPVISK